MSRAAAATAARVLTQLRRDPRTLVLVLGVPCLLETLLQQVFRGTPAVFQRAGVPLLGIFPLVSMFVVASVTMLRERTTGTLERLMTLPLRKLDLLAGYAAALSLVAVVQAAVVAALSFEALGLRSAGPPAAVAALAVADAILGSALGLFVSAFATSEFQAVQFLPAFVLPQLFLCGLFVDRGAMAPWLQRVADALPLTYAYDALERLRAGGPYGSGLLLDAGLLAGFVALGLLLGAATLRRRTA